MLSAGYRRIVSSRSEIATNAVFQHLAAHRPGGPPVFFVGAGRRRFLKADAEQQSVAAGLAHDAVSFPCAHDVCSDVSEVSCVRKRSGRVRRSRASLIAAAQPAGMPANVDPDANAVFVTQYFIASGDAAERGDAAGEVLPVDENIGNYLVVIDAPGSAGAAESGQYFIGNHQPFIAVADFADTLHEAS